MNGFVSAESEKAALACLFTHADSAMPWGAENFRHEDFSIPTNGLLFQRALEIFVSGAPVTFHALAIACKDDKLPVHLISELTTTGDTPASLPGISKQLRELRVRRELSVALTKAVDVLPTDGAIAACNVLAEAMERTSKLRVSTRPPSMKELSIEVMGRIDKRHRKVKEESGASTGLRYLDKETGGLRPGGTWILAGQAKGGKSTLAINLLESLAVHQKLRCMFVGLEMPAVENVERMFSSTGHISASAIRDGNIGTQDFEKLAGVSAALAAAPITFRDDLFDLTEIVNVIHQNKLANPDLFAVFVDYAQLVGDAHGNDDIREQEVARVSTAFRRIAMQDKLCVILLSQLNDEGKLRESRRLGQDATTIVFIEPDGENEGVRRLRLVQRNGRRCSIRVAYIGDRFRFADLADNESYSTDESTPETKRKKPKWYNS